MQEIIDFGIYNTLEWEQLSTEYLHGLADMGNIQAKEKLEKIYNSPIEIQKVGFGKYSTCKWIDLDVDYLFWLLDNVDANNIKAKLATKAIKYIEEHSSNDEFGEVIYVD
jgi:hypothetical protein